MNKHILDIQLSQTPPSRNRQCQNKSNSSNLHNKAKGILIINTVSLLKSFGYESSLISINRTICSFLDFIDPAIVYDICTMSWRNKPPSSVFNKCIILLIHGIFPICIVHRSTQICWLVRNSQETPSNSVVFVFFGLMNSFRGTSCWTRSCSHTRSYTGGISRGSRLPSAVGSSRAAWQSA